MALAPFRRTIRVLRGFLTIPGAISLSGLLVAIATWHLEAYLHDEHAGLVPAFLEVQADTAEAVFTVSAGASMSALVMVYSIVLLVYTMAASAIGPRLLQRFGDDRVSQVAVGSLGATFLYALQSLWMMDSDGSTDLTVAVGAAYMIVSVLLLLLFVQRVSTRVTIDQEAAEIARALDRQIDDAIARSTPILSSELVLPEGDERKVHAPVDGYVDAIEPGQLLTAARAAGATVFYDVLPGDFVIKGAPIATVFNDPDQALDRAVTDALPLLSVRTPEGDLRFSVNLLVEIALRALSPGVNDTFTAIACVDRLSAALATARAERLSTGVFLDSDGVARVVSPTTTADTLFIEAFPPLRRAARRNGLMSLALERAISRMIRIAEPDQREAMFNELRLLAEEVSASDQLEADKEELLARIDTYLELANRPLA